MAAVKSKSYLSGGQPIAVYFACIRLPHRDSHKRAMDMLITKVRVAVPPGWQSKIILLTRLNMRGGAETNTCSELQVHRLQ